MVLIAVLATVAINYGLSGYWVFLVTGAVIAGIALQGVGLVAGRTGMISLCQMSFAGVGAWVVAWLNVNHAPGTLILWTFLGGLAAVPFGIAIGLPALRLRGINLAIVTLGFAAAFDAILYAFTFPGQTKFIQVARPDWFSSDQAFLALCAGIFTLIAIGLDVLSRTPLGAAWQSIRHSERGTAAHGVSIPRAKLSAFALSAFIAGVSGGLLAGQLGTLVADSFNLMVSLVYYAVTTMAGAHLAEGALFGGVLIIFFPEILRRLGLPQDLGNIAFAIGATQALSMGGSFSEDLRTGLGRLFGRGKAVALAVAASDPAVNAPVASSSTQPALEIANLTVRYGSVVALDDLSLFVPQGTVVGLIGPNGAGKSTLIDAVAGFLASYEGKIMLAGLPIEGFLAHKRALAGVRRSWQTTRIAPQLSVGAYLSLAAGRILAPAETREVLSFFGCPGPETPIASVDAGTRRLLDVAGTVIARPKLVLLDEPAAGLSFSETQALADRIAEIPARFGSSVLLVEHDIDMVRKICSAVTVLDFGKVIASGPTAATLSDPRVVKAYVGEAAELGPA